MTINNIETLYEYMTRNPPNDPINNLLYKLFLKNHTTENPFAIDRHTIPHALVGAGLSALGINPFEQTALHLGFELWEHFVYPKWYPNWRETPYNSGVDLLAGFIGSLIGYFTIGKKVRRKW